VVSVDNLGTKSARGSESVMLAPTTGLPSKEETTVPMMPVRYVNLAGQQPASSEATAAVTMSRAITIGLTVEMSGAYADV